MTPSTPTEIRFRYRQVLVGLGLLLSITLLVALAVGAYTIPLDRLLTGKLDPTEVQVLTQIRLPRVLGAALVGSLLGIGGAVLQGLFRNPLVDPGLIGVSAGAALGAAVSIILVPGGLALLKGFALPIFAFLGGLAAVLLLWKVAESPLGTQVTVLLLAGIALNALVGALIGLLLFLANDQQLRSFTFWTLGGFSGVTWTALLAGAPFGLVALAASLRLGLSLNGLALGESEAHHLGVPLEVTKRWAIFGTALGVGVSVALAGGIGFVGLVVPHIFRLLAGPDHRYLLPGAALLGASLAVMADLLARTLVVPAELPVGVVTALVGGPYFLFLVVRYKREVGRA